MSVFVFIAVVVIAYFVVKIGAAAFELTGLNPEQANFQSVSAFTGTGFTTREAELVAAHKERRKIASVLMILGSAGFVTLIATLVTTINTRGPVAPIIPALENLLPGFLVQYVNLGIVLVLLFLMYKFFHSSRLFSLLMGKIQEQMLDKKLLQRARFEELLLNAEGYGISQIELTRKNPLTGKTLSESKLRSHDILVLSIEREQEHMINPVATTKLKLHDTLVCFGKLENIRAVAYESDK
jgi:hypothetical protein